MAIALDVKDQGRLAGNSMAITMLTRSVRNGESSIKGVPFWLERVLRDRCWTEWTDAAGGMHGSKDDKFEKFVTAEPPDGMGVTVEVVEALLKPDTVAWVLFHEELRGNPGGSNNPFGRTGKPEPDINRDNITVDSPNVIPINSKPARDYSKEAQTGTSASYGIRVLGDKRPDLLERVKAGEVSVNAALVDAGLRKKTITIPLEPVAAARAIRRHFKGEDFEALLRELSD